MSTFVIPLLVFACAFGAALVGMLLHVRLPDHHLNTDSKDVVKLVMGLIATMAALVLSLLIASANTSYNAQESELQSLSARITLLDRLLSFYGPEAKAARTELHDVVQAIDDRMWPRDGSGAADLDPRAVRGVAGAFGVQLQKLSPTTDIQRSMRSQAIQLSEGIEQTRLLMFEQSSNGVSLPFLTILVFWICMLFLGFGLFTRYNATVTAALLVGTLSVAAAVFLILELNTPYDGLMRISDTPLHNALAEIGS